MEQIADAVVILSRGAALALVTYVALAYWLAPAVVEHLT